MLNFRQFDAGPDPFGRKFQVFFKWMQTAISLRHSDTVDVRFILVEEGGGSPVEKTIALPHADLQKVSAELKRPMDDAWCSRLAAAHLLHLVETGEDMEKALVTVTPGDLKAYAQSLQGTENTAVHAG